MGTRPVVEIYRGLVAAFERIEAEPMTGRSRALFGPGMRSLALRKTPHPEPRPTPPATSLPISDPEPVSRYHRMTVNGRPEWVDS